MGRGEAGKSKGLLVGEPSKPSLASRGSGPSRGEAREGGGEGEGEATAFTVCEVEER